MSSKLGAVRGRFIEAISRVAHFWGFPKAMGAIYGAIYLSPAALSLDELVGQAGVSKGAVSTHVRRLERLQMVHRQLRVGDRKDYYEAETDFWKVVRSILRERERTEFDRALRSVSECLDTLERVHPSRSESQTAAFYRKRITAMKTFFATLDSIVATLLALDELRLGALKKLIGKKGRPRAE